MLIPRNSHKIVFLIRSLELGGAERVFTTYVNNVRKIKPIVLLHRPVIAPQNHLKPYIYCSEILKPSHPWKLFKREKRFCDASRNGGNINFINLALSRLPIIERLFEAYQIRKVAYQMNCRVVSSFMLKSNRVAIFTKLFFAPQLRVVLNVHESMSQHLKYDYICPLERGLHAWLSRLIFLKADLIIAVAEGVKHDIVSNFGADPNKIVVIPNPIDLQLIRQKGQEPIEEEFLNQSGESLIVAVGRLVRLKGFDLLIKAFSMLPSQIQTQLIIIGDGEEYLRLKNLIGLLGLQGRVHLLGGKENPWKYMARSDIVVLSSLTEAFPNVIGEAFALEKPVLATECSPGIRDYLNEGESGLLVESGNITALTNGLRLMLTDKSLCIKMAKRGAEQVKAYDVSTIVEKYEKVLAQII